MSQLSPSAKPIRCLLLLGLIALSFCLAETHSLSRQRRVQTSAAYALPYYRAAFASNDEYIEAAPLRRGQSRNSHSDVYAEDEESVTENPGPSGSGRGAGQPKLLLIKRGALQQNNVNQGRFFKQPGQIFVFVNNGSNTQSTVVGTTTTTVAPGRIFLDSGYGSNVYRSPMPMPMQYFRQRQDSGEQSAPSWPYAALLGWPDNGGQYGSNYDGFSGNSYGAFSGNSFGRPVPLVPITLGGNEVRYVPLSLRGLRQFAAPPPTPAPAPAIPQDIREDDGQGEDQGEPQGEDEVVDDFAPPSDANAVGSGGDLSGFSWFGRRRQGPLAFAQNWRRLQQQL